MSVWDCITFDPGRCINCKACEIHCAVWHRREQPLGRHAGGLPRGGEGGRILLETRFFTCMHCQHPPCLRACPYGAISLDADGLTRISADACTGCGACARACPTRIPFVDPTSGTAVKCDLCADRRAAGELPACVAGCPSGALSLTGGRESWQTAFRDSIRAFTRRHAGPTGQPDA